jgi:hypothetical protein
MTRRSPDCRRPDQEGAQGDQRIRTNASPPRPSRFLRESLSLSTGPHGGGSCSEPSAGTRTTTASGLTSRRGQRRSRTSFERRSESQSSGFGRAHDSAVGRRQGLRADVFLIGSPGRFSRYSWFTRIARRLAVARRRPPWSMRYPNAGAHHRDRRGTRRPTSKITFSTPASSSVLGPSRSRGRAGVPVPRSTTRNTVCCACGPGPTHIAPAISAATTAARRRSTQARPRRGRRLPG